MLLIPIVMMMTGCKNNYGILYTIFNVSYKNWKPLDNKKEAINEKIIGEYLVANERALQIEKKDSLTYSIRFLPLYLKEGVKELEGFITTLNNKQYLNVFTDDVSYLFFRLDEKGDSTEFNLLTNQAERYAEGADLAEWLRKGGVFPDTSHALFNLPLRKTASGEAVEFCKSKLRPQVTDLSTFRLYNQIFPQDEKTEELRAKGIEGSVTRTSSVVKLYKLGQDYPYAAARAKQRAREVCYTTQNCVDYLTLYPDDTSRDTLIELAFQDAMSESDYRLLIKKFPANERVIKVMTSLYFIERKRCKSDNDVRALNAKYKSDTLFSNVIDAVQIFDRIPFNEIKFNRSSYVLTKDSKELLNKILFSISEINKERVLVKDIFVTVNSDLVPPHYANADHINFRSSVNRTLTIKKYITAAGIKNVNFHFIPGGTASNRDSVSDGVVTITLDEKLGEEYKSRFLKLCLSKKGISYADANRELVTSTYIREEDLENYCLEVILENLKENEHAQVKIIPANFLLTEFKNDLPESEQVYLHFLTAFEENKIRKRHPEEFILDMK